jgi:hypothetical protein
MSDGQTFRVRLRSRQLTQDAAGYARRGVKEEQRPLDATRTALVPCDVRDCHTGPDERHPGNYPLLDAAAPVAG